LGQTVPPGGNYIKHKIMGKEFDAAKPEEYLKTFAIHKMG
jgi:nitrate/nitrite transport system substrate-binding protein